MLNFLDLKDEYSEHNVGDALINTPEEFLHELVGDLALICRQKRLRIGDEWHRIDLIFFNRWLKCSAVIEQGD